MVIELIVFTIINTITLCTVFFISDDYISYKIDQQLIKIANSKDLD